MLSATSSWFCLLQAEEMKEKKKRHKPQVVH